ncbi:MAG: hypothetical protein J0H49_03620 [Acidobacteria bacterium]|nr:hypothetical protein [Acidobacteriota bacterium]
MIPARTGDVPYDHAAHAKRERNACIICHPRLFPQAAKSPIAFKSPHKKHEDAKTSCGACHREGGAAFATKGNCTNSKCHTKAS